MQGNGLNSAELILIEIARFHFLSRNKDFNFLNGSEISKSEKKMKQSDGDGLKMKGNSMERKKKSEKK